MGEKARLFAKEEKAGLLTKEEKSRLRAEVTTLLQEELTVKMTGEAFLAESRVSVRREPGMGSFVLRGLSCQLRQSASSNGQSA